MVISLSPVRLPVTYKYIGMLIILISHKCNRDAHDYTTCHNSGLFDVSTSLLDHGSNLCDVSYYSTDLSTYI